MYYPPMSNLPAENLEPDHSCPLCNRKKTMPYHRDMVRDYLQCETCDLVFVPPGQHISAHEEKAYYDLHENLADDPSYRRFLSRLFTPLNARLAPNSSGLDFGSGPGPALPGTVGTLAPRANSIAATLSPTSAIVSADGPMNLMLQD